MRQVYKIIGIVLVGIMLIMPMEGRAADARTTAKAAWQEGIAAYENGDYSRAVEAFEHIVSLGEVSADLYYNLAGAYFKLGQQPSPEAARPFSGGELGRAILNYHRALRLNPALEDARYNLDIARDHTNDTEAVPNSFLTTMWLSLRNAMTSNSWTVLSIAALVVTLVLTLLYLLSERIVLRKVGFFLALVAIVLFVLSTALAISSRNATTHDKRAVVICNDTTPVHASPNSASKIIRRPSQGVTVSPLRDHEEWSEVLFSDGEKGWIRTTYIEKI